MGGMRLPLLKDRRVARHAEGSVLQIVAPLARLPTMRERVTGGTWTWG